MRRSALLAVAALVLPVLAISGAALATARSHPDHARVIDKAGDAPPGIDLRSGHYSITPKQARFTARLQKLTDTTFLAFEIWPLTDAWDRLAVFKQDGKVVAKNYFVDNSLEDSDQPVPHLVPCPGLRVHWITNTNTVTVVWPQSCRQASTRSTLPFEFHVFSRFGGQPNSPGDSLPARTLSF